MEIKGYPKTALCFDDTDTCMLKVLHGEIMKQNIETIKLIIADAIDHRTDPPLPQARAKYRFWIDLETRQIGCSWATDFQPKESQIILDTKMFNPELGLTSAEWDRLAKRFAPYILTEEPIHV